MNRAQFDKREIVAHLNRSDAAIVLVPESQLAIVGVPRFRGVSVFVGGSTYNGTRTPSI